MQRIFTTITNREYYNSIKTDALESETCWSINRAAAVGDLVLLYVCSPYSGIIATAVVADDVYQETDINSPWYGTWFAEMNQLELLKYPLTRPELVEIFPDWGYWKQPRNSIQIKQEYTEQIKFLIKSKKR